MDTVKLQVKERELTGNGPARRLRAEGRLPAVIYGKGSEGKAISLDVEELVAAVHHHGHNVILELEYSDVPGAAKGKKKAVLQYAVIKEVQRHPTKRSLLHVDLHEVHMGEEIEALVAVEPVGTPAGIIDGGVIDWDRREVTVRALPTVIPDSLELDISELVIGHHLTVESLKAPEGTQIMDDPGTILVALIAPRVEQAVETEGAEPEVVGGAPTEE